MRKLQLYFIIVIMEIQMHRQILKGEYSECV